MVDQDDQDEVLEELRNQVAERATEISNTLTEVLNARVTAIEEDPDWQKCDGCEKTDCGNAREAAIRIEMCAQYLVLMSMVIDGRSNIPDVVVQDVLMPMLPEETLKNMRDFILGKLLEATDDEPPPDSIH